MLTSHNAQYFPMNLTKVMFLCSRLHTLFLALCKSCQHMKKLQRLSECYDSHGVNGSTETEKGSGHSTKMETLGLFIG